MNQFIVLRTTLTSMINAEYREYNLLVASSHHFWISISLSQISNQDTVSTANEKRQFPTTQSWSVRFEPPPFVCSRFGRMTMCSLNKQRIKINLCFNWPWMISTSSHLLNALRDQCVQHSSGARCRAEIGKNTTLNESCFGLPFIFFVWWRCKSTFQSQNRRLDPGLDCLWAQLLSDWFDRPASHEDCCHLSRVAGIRNSNWNREVKKCFLLQD